MLYVFYGSDAESSRAKANALVQALQSKHADAELVRVTQDETGDLNLENLLATQGLFKSSYIIYLDNLNDLYKEWSKEEYKKMHVSGHVCVLLAERLGVVVLRDLEGNCDKLVESKASKSTGKFNIFGIANALKSRDKKRLWTELTIARLSGVEGEGVAGMLFWAVKDMLIKRQNNKWSESELKHLAISLAGLPHKARRDAVSVFNALERLLLQV